MYILQRLNVEKHTDDVDMRDKLIAQGFKLIEPVEKKLEDVDEVTSIEEKPVKEKKPKK